MKILTKILLILFLFNNIYFAFGNVETSSTGSLASISDDHLETTISDGEIEIVEEMKPEVIIEEISSDDNIQVADSSENSTSSGEVLKDIPTPIIEIQSGLEIGEGDNLDLCKKEDCKVNLTVEKIFTGDYNISDFSCKWDFGGGTWTTKDTDVKCNPGYVSYSKGEYKISIKIIDKNNIENFKESHIAIANHFGSEIDIITNSGTIIDEEFIIDDTTDEQWNEISGEDTTGSGIIEIPNTGTGTGTGNITGTGEINTGTGVSQEIVKEDTNSGIINIIEEEVFEIPEIIFEIQSGIEQIGTGTVYNCKKEDCKVNLTVEKLFTGSFNQSDFLCEWDFGSGSFTDGTDKKCNPGYVTYGTGVHEILLKLSEKAYSGNFSTGSITVLNGIEYDFWLTGTGKVLSGSGTESISNSLTGEGVHSVSSGTMIAEVSTTTAAIYSNTEQDSDENFINDSISIITDLQQPSYVTGVGDMFHCDQSKEECKVNFNFSILENFEETSSYTCKIDTNINANILESCNPATMIFSGTHNSVHIGIYDKENRNLVYQKEISIINNGYIKPRTQSVDNQIIEISSLDINKTSSGEIIVNTGDITQETQESFINPDMSVLIELQQPSYVNGVGDIFYCDRTKEECKVNFNFTILESLQVTNKYLCQITTTLDNEILESCNPATKIFSKGENNLLIKIYDKENLNLVYEKDIHIKNDGFLEQTTQSNNNEKIVEKIEQENIEKRLSIRIGEIEIQSGLDEDNICKKSDCKINLKYAESKGEKCEWSFPGGKYDEKTKFKCNPGYIDYGKYGEYYIELKVYDGNYEDNFKIQKISFSNNQNSTENGEIDMIREDDITEEGEVDYENFDTDFVIDLQGRKTDNKFFSGSTIFCYLEPCNINLDGSNSERSNGEKVSLNWELGENVFEGNNPKALWFNSGSHIIMIQDGKNQKNITLIVDKNAIKIGWSLEEKDDKLIDTTNQIVIDENILKYLKISAIFPNPKGVDNNEYIEIENTSNISISLLGVVLDDIIGGGSKPFTINEAIILQAGEKMKWYQYDTKLNLNNNKDSVNLSYNDTIIDSLSWNYNVADNYIITHKNSGIASQKVEVIRVIDGDTIEVRLENGEIERVRLIGVDTPEIYNPSNALELKYGQIANSYTKAMLLGKNLTLELEEINSRDTYGRLLGYIYLENGENFNENLIRNGYSRAYLVYDFKYSKQFTTAGNLAKKEKLIIWGDVEYKKIVNKIIKNDKIIIEKSEKHKDKLTAEAFYTDIDNNKIPDSFQIFLHDGENIVSSTGSMERYNDFVQNSFHINISMLNAGVKISGKTIANAELTFKISNKTYSTSTDTSGDFLLSIGGDFLASTYNVNIYITDIYGNNFTIEESKQFEIKEEYLKKLAEIEAKRLNAEAVKRAKVLARERKKLEKSKIAAQGKIYSNIFIKQAQSYSDKSNIRSNVGTHKNMLTFLIIILSLFMFFFILKRKKLL